MSEERAITPEIVKTDKDSEDNLKKRVMKDARGLFVKGNPGAGRPPGVPNKFTRMKYDLLEAWQKAGGKKRFLELLQGNKADFKWCVERIITILPKETMLDFTSDSPMITFQFIKNDKTDKNDKTIDVTSQ